MKKKEVISYFQIFFGLFLLALSYNTLLYPMQIISGSASGLAIILSAVLPLKAGHIILILNIPILIWCFSYFGLSIFIKSGIAGVLLPWMILWMEKLPVIYLSAFGNAVIGGIISGLGVSILYLANTSTGGTAAIAQIFHCKYNWDKGKLLLLLDGLIVISGLLIYPIKKIFISVICVICLTTTVTLFHYANKRKTRLKQKTMI